jgi:transcriptional regulator with XRE-family HTH domain
MDLRDALAANIRSMRARKQLDQETVAARMRDLGFATWTRQTVHATEKPVRRVTAEEIFALAQVLDVPVLGLLEMSSNGAVHFPSGHDVPAA